MTRLWLTIGLGVLMIVGVPALAPGQMPGMPGAGGAPGGAADQGAAPGTTASGAGGKGNLWSFLCPTQQQDECAEKFCNCILGKILNGLLAPISAFSGGLIPPLCPPNAVSKAALAMPADSLDGAAARIKKDEADAKARRANVRYLATVDCHRYPEAEKALIAALRTDHNECVRLEAALALGTGCCCTRPIIEALALTAGGGDKDGNPAEFSPRVRHAANMSLLHCLDRASFPVTQEPPEKPAGIPEPTNSPNPVPVAAANSQEQQVAYQVSQPVRLTPVAATQPAPAPSNSNPIDPRTTSGKHGLFDLFNRSFAQSPR